MPTATSSKCCRSSPTRPSIAAPAPAPRPSSRAEVGVAAQPNRSAPLGLGHRVLVPLLLLFYPHESPDTIASISLAVVFFNALSGTLAYARLKRVDYGSGVLLSVATIPGAILGALTTGRIADRPCWARCKIGRICGRAVRTRCPSRRTIVAVSRSTAMPCASGCSAWRMKL